MKFTSFPVSIVSFNAMSVFSFDSIHGFISSFRPIRRQQIIAETLLRENADLITLQEIHTYFVLNIYKRKLNYPHVAYKRYIYGPRGGLVIFSKLPIEKTNYLNFSKRGSMFNSSFIAKIIRNGALICKLKNTPLTVLNVHATPNLDHADYEHNRFIKFIDAQLTQIADFMNDIKRKKEAVIIGGDLNVAKDSSTYKKFLKNSELLDVFAKDDFPTQHQEYLPGYKKVDRIDYVFMKDFKNTAKVKSTDYLFQKKVELSKGKNRYLSDHIGLKAKLIFNFDTV